ncbi:MAG TPA: hypothetical protein VHK45_02025 [Geminicoccaceae bacterium]|jgi:hypothetical protein|nr:hypothetical protein [Geminicoccaceae bacterium]
MLARCITAIGLLLIAGCTHDPLARANLWPGLVEVEAPTGELTRVMFSAAEAPARQGLLHIAMYDAGVAAQNAGLARGSGVVSDVQTRVGEVLYAIDPEIAPAWPAKTTGIVEVWAGSGYGLRRALRGMIEEITAAVEGGAASAALRRNGPRAIRCIENTLTRADQTAALGERVLAAAPGADFDPMLRQLEEVAVALNNGVPSPEDEGCGLQQAFRYLSEIGLYAAEGSWGA